jgi:hypothetical protein
LEAAALSEKSGSQSFQEELEKKVSREIQSIRDEGRAYCKGQSFFFYHNNQGVFCTVIAIHKIMLKDIAKYLSRRLTTTFFKLTNSYITEWELLFGQSYQTL